MKLYTVMYCEKNKIKYSNSWRTFYMCERERKKKKKKMIHLLMYCEKKNNVLLRKKTTSKIK